MVVQLVPFQNKKNSNILLVLYFCICHVFLSSLVLCLLIHVEIDNDEVVVIPTHLTNGCS